MRQFRNLKFLDPEDLVKGRLRRGTKNEIAEKHSVPHVQKAEGSLLEESVNGAVLKVGYSIDNLNFPKNAIFFHTSMYKDKDLFYNKKFPLPVDKESLMRTPLKDIPGFILNDPVYTNSLLIQRAVFYNSLGLKTNARLYDVGDIEFQKHNFNLEFFLTSFNQENFLTLRLPEGSKPGHVLEPMDCVHKEYFDKITGEAGVVTEIKDYEQKKQVLAHKTEYILDKLKNF